VLLNLIHVRKRQSKHSACNLTFPYEPAKQAHAAAAARCELPDIVGHEIYKGIVVRKVWAGTEMKGRVHGQE